MITYAVHIDARRDDDRADRKAAGALYSVRPGSKVILFVGDRTLTSWYLVAHARQFVPTLHIEVQGAAAACEAWVRALNGLEPEDVGVVA